jgi:transposase
MSGQFVKAFNIRNKNDAADAQAIWRVVQQPSKPIAVKTEMQQQAMLSLHRMREQFNEIVRLDERIAAIEGRMSQWKKQDRAVKAISAIPGVGLLTATAAVAVMGDAKVFRSGRKFGEFV